MVPHQPPFTKYTTMYDEKQFDEGMLTFEDRYPGQEEVVDEVAAFGPEEAKNAWDKLKGEEAPIKCICGGLGLFGQYHHDQCPKFNDDSHAPEHENS